MNLTKSKLVLVHIGKCGGSTVRSEMSKTNLNFEVVHINKVNYDPNKKYLIVIRNPITRFISAFNWRKKLILNDEVQKHRFKGEHETLNKFKDTNDLAEKLYDKNNILIFDFQKTENYIHHITEDINFYIGDFLDKCQGNEIIDVIVQETLSEDLNRIFGINCSTHLKKNPNYKTKLSKKGLNNLKKYLKLDYTCIEKLNNLNLLSKEKYRILSK